MHEVTDDMTQATVVDKNKKVLPERCDGMFRPGGPGGPGRPRRELSITEQLRAKAMEAVREGDATRVEQLAVELWDMALTNEDPRLRLQAAQLITDRLEGRPGVHVSLSRGDDDDLEASVARLHQLAASRPELLQLLPPTDPMRTMLDRGMDSGERSRLCESNLC